MENNYEKRATESITSVYSDYVDGHASGRSLGGRRVSLSGDKIGGEYHIEGRNNAIFLDSQEMLRPWMM